MRIPIYFIRAMYIINFVEDLRKINKDAHISHIFNAYYYLIKFDMMHIQFRIAKQVIVRYSTNEHKQLGCKSYGICSPYTLALGYYGALYTQTANMTLYGYRHIHTLSLQQILYTCMYYLYTINLEYLYETIRLVNDILHLVSKPYQQPI